MYLGQVIYSIYISCCLQVLGPLPESEEEAYAWTLELYSYTRMLLAALPQDELAKVCDNSKRYGGEAHDSICGQ
jgi:hypothetical protein